MTDPDFADLADEPRRSAGGVRSMRLRTWKQELKIAEDFVAEHGGADAFMAQMCAWVADGGYLRQLCEEHSVSQAALMAWVRADEERARRYDAAVEDRRSVQRESAPALWAEVMATPARYDPTYSEILKASEYMAKHSGALRDGARVEISTGDGANVLSEALGLAAVALLEHVRAKEPRVIEGETVPERILMQQE